MPLRIEAHKLAGDLVSYRETPNHGGVMAPRFLVMHFTAGRSLETSVESLCTQKPSGNASAHLVLGRDGRMVQLAPFNVVTWHAGVSAWKGLNGLNSCSIGIEMDNAGQLNKVGDKYVAWFGKEYPASEVMLAEHKHGGGVRPWHAYTELQIERALELAELLVAHYGLEEVVGHEDIAPTRKTDPGPAFPLEALRSRVSGRQQDAAPQYLVTASSLNIRKGPDASFEPVATALKKGTRVTLLEARDRWSRVEVQGPTDLEGWVNNAYLEAAPAVAPRGVGRGAKPAAARSAKPKANTRAAKIDTTKARTSKVGTSKVGTTKPSATKQLAIKRAAAKPPRKK